MTKSFFMKGITWLKKVKFYPIFIANPTHEKASKRIYTYEKL